MGQPGATERAVLDDARPRNQPPVASVASNGGVNMSANFNIAGALYAHKLRFLSPDQFTFLQSIELLIIRSVLTYDKDKQLFLDARDNPIRRRGVGTILREITHFRARHRIERVLFEDDEHDILYTIEGGKLLSIGGAGEEDSACMTRI